MKNENKALYLQAKNRGFEVLNTFKNQDNIKT